MLWLVPALFYEHVIEDSKVPLWVQGPLFIALPQAIAGYLITCSIPKLSIKLCRYPDTLTEFYFAVVHDSSDELEEKKDLKKTNNTQKNHQLKGKFYLSIPAHLLSS